MKSVLNIIQEEVQNFNENFYRWFGQSKVVDKRGQPLRVYHGTQADFDTFKSETGLMYFSKTPQYASAFATNSQIKHKIADSQRSVLPVYLSIQKPLDLLKFENEIVSRYEFAGELDDRGVEINSDDLKDYPMNINIGEDVQIWQWIRFNAKYLVPRLKAKGFDGIFMYEKASTGTKDISDVAYVVFSPTQIKSATGNNGEYSQSNPDITKENMNIKQIVREELSAYNKESIEEQLLSELTVLSESIGEGVADKYAERQFNIPDQSKQQDQQATQAMPAQNTQGEYVGDVVNDYNEFYGQKGKQPVESRIFANPRSLQGFDNHTRAISDIDGNLFVAEHNGMFFHQEIEEVVKVSKYGSAHTEYMQWYRQGGTNMFTWSSTYSSTNQFRPEVEQQYIQALQKKNPQYKFLVPQQPKSKPLPTYPIAGQNVQENQSGTIDNGNENGKVVNGNEQGKIRGGNETGSIDNSNERGKVVNGNEFGKVVKEELQAIIDGVADKAAEKLFNIPDPNVGMNQKAVAGIKDLPPDASDNKLDTELGKLVGEMPVYDHGQTIDMPIYLNPRSLRDFDEDVKAVSNKLGDLFVGQLDLAYYHDDLMSNVKAKGIYQQPIYNAYDESENITWHRIGKTNEFGWSVSYRKFGYKPENRKFVAQMMQVVMKKNPEFRFIPQYWEETKQQRYDKEHNINTDSLLNY